MGAAVSTARSTAVAFSVSQETDTVRSPRRRIRVAHVERRHLLRTRSYPSSPWYRSCPWSSGSPSRRPCRPCASCRREPRRRGSSRDGRPGQVGAREVGVGQVGVDDLGSAQVALREVCAAQVHVGEIRPGEVRAGKARILEIGAGEVDVRALCRRLDDATCDLVGRVGSPAPRECGRSECDQASLRRSSPSMSIDRGS